MYKISLFVIMFVALISSYGSAAYAAKVVELMPSTAEVVRDRINFDRANSNSQGSGADMYSTQIMIFPTVVIDIREKLMANPSHTINVNDIKEWEQTHGRIPRGSIVLLYTGWQAEWGRPDAAGGEFSFPTCDGTVTPFLLGERGVAGVGIDREHDFTPEGVDPVQLFLARLASKSEGIVLENLQHLDQLPATGADLRVGFLYRGDTREKSTVSVKAFIN